MLERHSEISPETRANQIMSMARIDKDAKAQPPASRTGALVRNPIFLGVAWSLALAAFLFGVWSNDRWLKVFGTVMFLIPALWSRHLLFDFLLEDLPAWFRTDRDWNGNHHSFENYRVRIIEGEGDTPSFVVLDDILKILGIKPASMDISTRRRKFGRSLHQTADPRIKGQWVVEDRLLVDYLGQLALIIESNDMLATRLKHWLERSVFCPIDNRRTLASGKAYPFTNDVHVKRLTPLAAITPASFKAAVPPPRDAC